MARRSAAAETPLGVGFLGAGPVTQAIHLPTLARMPERFHVAHVMDVSPVVAESVAGRVDAAFSTSIDALLADPSVDVVAVCSPPQFHAQQVIAAMRAGKRGILCEKPTATTVEDAASIAAASDETGVPVVIGAMHVFDPGWMAAAREWGDLPDRVHTVRSSIVLPPNSRFEDWATEILERPPAGEPIRLTPEVVRSTLSGLVLGLAVHDLPLVRAFLPEPDRLEVLSARLLPEPVGYAIDARVGDRAVQLQASFHEHWAPNWELEAIADDAVLRTRFTPSYVHAGSATATLERADGTATTWGPFDHDGYEAEWLALDAVMAGDTNAAPTPDAFIADLALTLDVARQAVDRALEGLER